MLFKNVQADLQYLEGREVMESEGASECAALCLQVDMDPDSIPSFQMFNLHGKFFLRATVYYILD